MSVLTYYFGWPDGAVWSNLLASLIWAAPALWHLHWKLNRQHRERMGVVRPPRSQRRMFRWIRSGERT